MLRLAFMGTPEFSVPALDALLAAGHEVGCVYSQPPRPAHRGHQVQPSPVHRFAESRGLTVRTPKSLRTPEAQAEFAALDLDAAVVVAYGLILPQPILDAPRHGCFNIHASLLPRWRGAAPIQRAILAGDRVTGVTIMQMDAGLDTGPMLLRAEVPIHDDTTASALHDELSALGARLIVETLGELEAGRLHPVPQPADGVTYAAKLTKEDGRIDWSADAAAIERRIRALTPWPGVSVEIRGERVKLLAAERVDGSGTPGTTLDDRLAIACGTGALRPTRLQRPGKSPVELDALLRGFPVPAGTAILP